METWAIPHFTRESQKSGSFLRQLNGYLAMRIFRNRKYRTALFFFQIWKMSFVFQLININNHIKLTWKLKPEVILEVNLKSIVHFGAHHTTNISRTCELKTQNRRLETITNLLIKTLATWRKNLKKDVFLRTFSHAWHNNKINAIYW
jgi:hypothetical protein